MGCLNVVTGSKKHHYTPNFILRRFADPSKTLWVWDKEMHECRPVRGGPKERCNAFFENHYNTIFDEGKPDRSIEQYLASVDTGAAPVIDKIVEHARAGLMPVLIPDEKERLCRFLWIQHLRSPHTRAGVVQNEESKRLAFDSIRRTAKGADIPEAEIRRLMGDVESLIEGAAKKVVTMQYSRSQDYMTNEMSLDVGRVPPKVDVHLVISDRPCLIGALLKPSARVCMPIAEGVLVQLSRADESPGDLRTLGLQRVGEINGQTFREATRFVAGSCAGYLQHLADHHRDMP